MISSPLPPDVLQCYYDWLLLLQPLAQKPLKHRHEAAEYLQTILFLREQGVSLRAIGRALGVHASGLSMRLARLKRSGLKRHPETLEWIFMARYGVEVMVGKHKYTPGLTD